MIGAYCNDSVNIITETRDKFNEITETSSESVDCRLIEEVKVVMNEQGDEVISTGRVEFPGDYDIDSNSKIRYNSIDYVIISKVKRKSFSEILKTVYYIQ